MKIKTIQNNQATLEAFAKELHKMALNGEIKPLDYNQQSVSTLRNQRFKLSYNKFQLTCDDGEVISKIGFINFMFLVIKKGTEGIGIDFDKVRFPFIATYIRRSAIIDVEEVEKEIEGGDEDKEETEEGAAGEAGVGEDNNEGVEDEVVETDKEDTVETVEITEEAAQVPTKKTRVKRTK